MPCAATRRWPSASWWWPATRPIASSSTTWPWFETCSAERRCASRPREGHDERRPRAGFTLDVDRAAVHVHELARDPQAQPQAAEVARRHRALEAQEDALLVIARDADAQVLHAQHRRRALR